MMTLAQKEPPLNNRTLYRFARRLYLKNYRAQRFGSGAGDYIIQIALSLGAGGYTAFQTYQRLHTQDGLGAVFAICLTGILAWSVLYGANKLLNLYFEACAFAEQAILVAGDPAEIEQYFDDIYPWVFYHK